MHSTALNLDSRASCDNRMEFTWNRYLCWLSERSEYKLLECDWQVFEFIKSNEHNTSTSLTVVDLLFWPFFNMVADFSFKLKWQCVWPYIQYKGSVVETNFDRTYWCAFFYKTNYRQKKKKNSFKIYVSYVFMRKSLFMGGDSLGLYNVFYKPSNDFLNEKRILVI